MDVIKIYTEQTTVTKVIQETNPDVIRIYDGFPHVTKIFPLIVVDEGESVDIDVSKFVFNEIPNGLINGSNAIFTTNFDFISTTLQIKINGIYLKPESDFTNVGANTISFFESPEVDDEILINYIKL